MRLLTPLGALAALAALLPLVAILAGRARVRGVRRALGLAPPRRRSVGRPTAALLGVALLGLAAAQPALESRAAQRVRTGVAVLFVIDTSRSMAASATPSSPTRLDRALTAAVRLRAAIGAVPAGIATLTDRVLPDLLPVPDVAGFDAVAGRGVAIEDPPPFASAVRATTYDALSEVASGNYFAPSAHRRIVVLLSDGESGPFDPAQVAAKLAAARGYRFLAMRFWGAGESVYDAGGRAEPGYHPDPAGAALLAGLASALRGRSFEEGDLGGASAYLRSLAATGRTVTRPGTERTQQALTPYVAAAALVLLTLAMIPPRSRARV